ncbi:Aste57867_14504 [Aphanomyces stellatus]|uniref:Aste57867_14504 protein n=1 Tax=Aphanomyces stellatus TaxID=120398 RepID=A0A485L0X6_9STRA|nr:hypothetical protein As57867_014450 [Aphanomyces stellatus]VFT91326.1 Aste57867_14504 [Aphanomyces stellatus]
MQMPWVSTAILALVALSSQSGADDCPRCGTMSVSCTDETDAFPVCDANGLIQSDDVLCDADGCTCAPAFSCVDLRFGSCEYVYHGGKRTRCISLDGLQARSDAYSKWTNVAPITYTLTGWTHFQETSRGACASDDCLAAQQLEACNVVVCGTLVLVWQDFIHDGYVFVVDGTIQVDRDPSPKSGVFLLAAPWNAPTQTLSCDIDITAGIEKEYVRQTRNIGSDSDCKGRYVDYTPIASGFMSDIADTVSRTSWTVWLTVASAIGAAIAAIVAVVHTQRHYRAREKALANEAPLALNAEVI